MVRGTHAHAFVTSFIGLEDLNTRTLTPNEGAELPEKVNLEAFSVVNKKVFVTPIVKPKLKSQPLSSTKSEKPKNEKVKSFFPAGFCDVLC